MRRVLSVWLPAWPIARLARALPSAVPKDKPFALVASGVHGLTVSAVNEVAAGEGVAIGSALADARAALPALLSRRAEPAADRLALLRLARWAGRYGPNRHRDGDDGLWIDVTGVAHLFGGEECLLNDVTRRLASFGVPSCAGLADTLGAAHALARFGCPADSAWALAPSGQTRGAIAPLPVEALRLEGARVLLLKRLGLRHIGQLYDIPRDSLARRFRSKDAAGAVLTRLDSALGLTDEPRGPMQTPPVLSVMRAFTDPLISSDALETAVTELCGELAASLAAKDLGVKTAGLSLYRSDGTTAKASAMMSTPSRDGAHIFMLLKEKLAGIDAGFGIDVVRLDALSVERRRIKQGAFVEARGHCDIAPLIDRLANRFGGDAITLLRPQASHIPERAEIRVPALQALRYQPPWPYGGGPNRRSASRPPFLLKRPEPIDVLAEVPDGPPARFTWRRVERRIARAQGPERIAPEWWRHLDLDEDQKRPRPRDYYRIEDHDGAGYWVFRHGLYSGDDDGEDNGGDPPRWFLHGLFS